MFRYLNQKPFSKFFIAISFWPGLLKWFGLFHFFFFGSAIWYLKFRYLRIIVSIED